MAPTAPTLRVAIRDEARNDSDGTSERDDSSSGGFDKTASEDVGEGHHPDPPNGVIHHDEKPTLVHRFHHNRSILCLVVTEEYVYAGSQGGDLLVFALDTYERVREVSAHDGSILGLCLSQNDKLLFSSASDRIIHIWDTRTLQRKASLFSHYDVGDIFCVSYCSRLRTVYLGCQNTSIQWVDLTDFETKPGKERDSLPHLREDRFFDSLGPGGVCEPKQDSRRNRCLTNGGRILEIPRSNIHQFAHFGYVYCILLCRGASANLQAEEVLISGGGDGAVSLWTLDKEKGGRIQHCERLEDGREDANSVLTIVLDGTLLFSGRVGGEINVWDLDTRQLVRAFKADDSDILSLSIGRDNLISLDENGTAKQYNQRYECTASWHAHDGRALASAIVTSRGRTTLLTGGSDDSVGLWNIEGCSSPRPLPTRSAEDDLVNSLRKFISYRTVSSDSRYKADCRKGASYLRALLKSFGAITELIKTENGSNPIVYARFKGEVPKGTSVKRILFYGHYDVVSADNKYGRWVNDPFDMAGIDGYFYGRGVSDNKGPVMAAIYAVADIVAARKLKSDIIFLIEGEEECGSRGFKHAIRNHKELIGHVDWILLANSYWLDDEIPCLTYGLRGVIHATVELDSDQPDLHSGVDGSRLLDEPLKDLVMLTARLSGPDGAVRLPDFYAEVLPLTQRERILYKDIADSLLARNPALGTPKSLTASLMGRWREASLTVHGFRSSGSENSTIIPHHAQVSLSVRLVPGQVSQTISKTLLEFLQAEFASLCSKNKLTIKINNQAEPWLGDPSNFIFRTLERAVVNVWSRQRRHNSLTVTPSSPSLNPSHAPRRASIVSNQKLSQPATSSMLASSSVPAAPESPRRPGLDGKTDSAEPSMQRSVDLSSHSWKPLYIREGGSIPAIRFLEKEFDAPAAHLPCGQASDNAHLENERLRVLNLLNSREIFRRVFTDLI